MATVLNEARDIDRTVSSLLAQVPPAAEVVVVDGGSTDGTWERLGEWLAAAQEGRANSTPRLVAIRDESCSIKHSAGPRSRGRNVAIAAAQSEIIACADAGCTYAPDWLANLTAPLTTGEAEYALGGSCLDPDDYTLWDVASAPFFSIKLSPAEPTKSCTARSMAFTKQFWQRVGGFPEDVLIGEDTLFDLAARRLTPPAFPNNAKAFYHPRNSFRSACGQMARYAVSDGQARVRPARLIRNAARCVAELLALSLLPWTMLPLAAIFLLECWYAYHRDWRDLARYGPRAIAARFLFSVAVPWVVAANQIRGLFSSKALTNRQNPGG
ncbi:MAG: glycosyltransferase [Terriglobia bacterium]